MFRKVTIAPLVAFSGVAIAEKPEPPERVQTIASQAAGSLNGWQLHHVDSEPTARAGAKQCYRVMLRRRYKVYPERETQQRSAIRGPDEPFEWRHEDWELVLVPLDGRLPTNVSEMAKDIDFRPRKTGVHLRTVYLGTSSHSDYALFTLASIHDQERLRDALHLSGGDDRIQLAVEGLSVEDAGTQTANSMPFILAKFGDAALPYLNRAIDAGGDIRRHILAIGKIPTSQATERLMELYRSGDEQKQEAAASALSFGWRRESAKPVYLQMIRDRQRVHEVAPIAAEFNWTEAVEPLKQAIADPPSLFDYFAAFRAVRSLQGDPVPDAIEKAKEQIQQAGYASGTPVDQQALDSGVLQIIESEDTPAAMMAGLELTVFVTKGDVRAVNAAGVEVLESLPAEQVLKTIESLAASLDNPDHRERFEQLLAKMR